MSRDVIIIGGGTAGLGAARGARAVGADPVLIAEGPIGGDCTFTGCIPSKTLIADSVRGVRFADSVDRMRSVIEEIAATEDARQLTTEGIEVIEGRARLTGPTSVAIGGRTLTTDHIVVATGARPAVPPIDGLESVPYLTNETLFELDRLPERLAIVGAGPIGAEMAMAFAGFGTQVTLYELGERVLPVEEAEASQLIEDAMLAAGVDVRTGVAVASVALRGTAIDVTANDGTKVEVDALLIATGRTPNTADLGLAEAGVELTASGHIAVDGKLRTNVASIRAAGDVTGLLPFTHSADEQGRLAVAHALRQGARWSYDPASTPWVTFTTPEVARVGLTEAEAASHGARVAYLPLDHVDRALTEDRTQGFVKLIAGPKRLTRNAFGGQLLGATIVAPRAGEMIHAPTMVLRLGMFVGRLAQVTVPYPTWTTAIQQAAGQFFRPVNGLEARPARRDR